MKLENIQVGQRLRICGKYLLTPLNSICTVLNVTPVSDEWTSKEDFPYPFGMVEVHLDDSVEWPVRDVWIGPEDLTDVEWAVDDGNAKT